MKKLKQKFKNLFKKENLINTLATMLTISLLIFAVTYSVAQSANKIKSWDIDNLTNTFEKMNEGVKDTSFITNPIGNSSMTNILKKFKNCNLDLADENKFSYEKYQSSTLTISSDLTLTDCEIGILYNKIIEYEVDALDTYVYEVTFTKLDQNNSIKTISTIDINKAIDRTQLDSSIKLSQSRVYLTNYTLVSDNNMIYSDATFNLLTEEESKTITSYLSLQYNLNSYVPDEISNFINSFAEKTNTTTVFSNNTVTFKINT